MPRVEFRDSGDELRSTESAASGALIIFFHPLCQHCAYELAKLDSAAVGFDQQTIYMLTTDDSLFSRHIARRWPRLASHPSVIWGIVDRKDFNAKFGTLVTPTAFLFDRSGRFVRRIKGETPLENLGLQTTSGRALEHAISRRSASPHPTLGGSGPSAPNSNRRKKWKS
jgi:hypothetical protein